MERALARHIRAFTLDSSTISAVGRFINEEGSLQLLLTTEAPQSTLDDHELQPQDYEELYKLVGGRKGANYGKFTTPPPALEWKPFLAQWKAAMSLTTPQNLAVEQAVKERQKANRQAVKKLQITTSPSASRVVDALIVLGIATIRERAARIDAKGSARKDAGEGGHKLSNSSRRKKAAV